MSQRFRSENAPDAPDAPDVYGSCVGSVRRKTSRTIYRRRIVGGRRGPAPDAPDAPAMPGHALAPGLRGVAARPACAISGKRGRFGPNSSPAVYLSGGLQ
jgi:hypothetical protein